MALSEALTRSYRKWWLPTLDASCALCGDMEEDINNSYQALSELHDKVPPFPRVVAMKIIEEELGSPERSFAYISEEPVAAASFGQVYYARTLDGSDVAVKVQRPNLLHAVVRDIYILRIGINIAKSWWCYPCRPSCFC